MTDEITDKQKAFLLKSGIKVSYGMSKQEASKMIDEIINKGKKKEEVIIAQPIIQQARSWNEKPKFDTSSFYVAYSKDLCIAMLNAHALKMSADATIPSLDVGLLMAQAIMCIEKAKKAFE